MKVLTRTGPCRSVTPVSNTNLTEKDIIMSESTITITLDDAIELLTSIVKDEGYEHLATSNGGSGCRYVENDGGRLVSVCIVGRLFDYLGILRATVTAETHPFGATDQYGACNINEPVWARAEVMGVVFPSEVQEFLRGVQSDQDTPMSWGRALENAVERHHNVLVSEAEDALHRAEAHKERRLRGLPQKPADKEPLAPWEADLLNGVVGKDEQPF